MMQLVNVKKLFLSELGNTEKVSLNDDISNFELTDDVEGKSVSGEFKLTRLDESILVEGKFTAEIVAICDRCLDNFLDKVETSVEREYVLDRKKEEPDVLFVDKYFNIDLSEAIREELVLAMPMKKICKKDCKGICPNCGENLNHEKCRCKNNPKD